METMESYKLAKRIWGFGYRQIPIDMIDELLKGGAKIDIEEANSILHKNFDAWTCLYRKIVI